jgi:DNA (cytosine-5)-methyltransferase 1
LEINKDNISNTLTSVAKDNLVIERIVQVGNLTFSSRFGGNAQDGRIYAKSGIAPTLRAGTGPMVLSEIKIRRLTPLECWRLMGFDDTDFLKAAASGVSNTQLYKQAGNSIVVNVLEEIFKKLIFTMGK